MTVELEEGSVDIGEPRHNVLHQGVNEEVVHLKLLLEAKIDERSTIMEIYLLDYICQTPSTAVSPDRQHLWGIQRKTDEPA